MKVSHKSVGGTPGQMESGKAGKSESARGLKHNSRAGAHIAPKDGSKVDVSERAQMMQKAKDIAGAQTVDEAKVARFQKLIDEGNYHVDSEKIADKLVDDHMLIPD
jgi:negative regulator of flagellin synthesis FlgM